MANLMKKITLMWGTRDLDKFIQSLFMDSRDGARQGFPPPVAAELMFLGEVNKMVRALDSASKLGISVTEAHRIVDAGDQAFVTTGSPWDDPSASMDGLAHEDSQHHETKRKSGGNLGVPVQSLDLVPAKSAGKGAVFWICLALIALAVIQLGMKLFAHFK